MQTKIDEESIILHGKIIGTEAVKNVQTLLSNGARTNGQVLPTCKRVSPRFDESAFTLMVEMELLKEPLSEFQTSFKTPPLSSLLST